MPSVSLSLSSLYFRCCCILLCACVASIACLRIKVQTNRLFKKDIYCLQEVGESWCFVWRDDTSAVEHVWFQLRCNCSHNKYSCSLCRSPPLQYKYHCFYTRNSLHTHKSSGLCQSRPKASVGFDKITFFLCVDETLRCFRCHHLVILILFFSFPSQAAHSTITSFITPPAFWMPACSKSHAISF